MYMYKNFTKPEGMDHGAGLYCMIIYEPQAGNRLNEIWVYDIDKDNSILPVLYQGLCGLCADLPDDQCKCPQTSGQEVILAYC